MKVSRSQLVAAEGKIVMRAVAQRAIVMTPWNYSASILKCAYPKVSFIELTPCSDNQSDYM